ncbi:MAG TPA: hypothetical protein VHH90_07365 [Polyangia bacterium]|nr:hypothetical protein [Polyangia bacterium]
MRTSLFHRLGLAVAVLALSMAGCGSSSNANADAFVGTWAFQSGSIMPMCPVAVADLDLTADVVTIAKVDSSHVLLSIAATGVTCDVRFAVDGTTATAESNQTCSIVASGQSAVVNVTSWTLVQSGMSINMSMKGTSSVSASGFTLTCTPTSTGIMVRGSSDAAQGG